MQFQLDGTGGKTYATDAGGMWPLQPWSVGPGAKPQRWASFTRDTRKSNKRVLWRLDYFRML